MCAEKSGSNPISDMTDAELWDACETLRADRKGWRTALKLSLEANKRLTDAYEMAAKNGVDVDQVDVNGARDLAENAQSYAYHVLFENRS